MNEPLTDAERGVLERMRADQHDRFGDVARSVLEDLAGRGLVLLARSRTDEHYGITDRGRAALEVPSRD